MSGALHLTSLPSGALKLETGINEAQMGSAAKMVSLADLHGSTPATPREPEQQVDPTDPLLQMLVQDRQFIAAVQGSQLHAAAAMAVKLLRAHFAAIEFKRPPDRRPEDLTPRAAAGLPAAAPRLQPLAAQRPTDPRQREALDGLKAEALLLEDAVPWNSVRRTWRSRRTTWRRQMKQGESIPELALRLKELRAALLADETSWTGCGHTWQAQLDACVQGKGSCSTLLGVWDELRASINAWLGGRNRGTALSAGALRAGVARALGAMQAAALSGDADALLQLPLESILSGDMHGLAAVRRAIELERRALAAKLAAGEAPGSAGQSKGGSGKPLASYFSSIQAPWADSDFDSGADTDMEDADSDATDLDTEF